MHGFSKFFGGIALGFRAARFAQTLNGLSDRELADIGITRGEIGHRALLLAEQGGRRSDRRAA